MSLEVLLRRKSTRGTPTRRRVGPAREGCLRARLRLACLYTVYSLPASDNNPKAQPKLLPTASIYIAIKELSCQGVDGNCPLQRY